MMNATRAGAIARASVLVCLATSASAQDRLKSMPGYDQYQRMLPVYRSAVAPMTIAAPGGVSWSPDGKSFEYDAGGVHYRYDIVSKKASEVGTSTASAGGGRGRGRGGGGGQPARGRQFELAIAPVGNHRA